MVSVGPLAGHEEWAVLYTQGDLERRLKTHSAPKVHVGGFGQDFKTDDPNRFPFAMEFSL